MYRVAIEANPEMISPGNSPPRRHVEKPEICGRLMQAGKNLPGLGVPSIVNNEVEEKMNNADRGIIPAMLRRTVSIVLLWVLFTRELTKWAYMV